MLTAFDKDLFAKELRTYRNENGLKQSDLANNLKLNRATISFFENQQQLPSTDVLNKICKLLGKPIDYFFVPENMDPLMLMMGKMKEDDKETLINVIERIKVRKKYISLCKRLGD